MSKKFTEWLKLNEIAAAGKTLVEISNIIKQSIDNLDPYMPDEHEILDKISQLVLGRDIPIGQELLYQGMLKKKINEMIHTNNRKDLISVFHLLNPGNKSVPIF